MNRIEFDFESDSQSTENGLCARLNVEVAYAGKDKDYNIMTVLIYNKDKHWFPVTWDDLFQYEKEKILDTARNEIDMKESKPHGTNEDHLYELARDLSLLEKDRI